MGPQEVGAFLTEHFAAGLAFASGFTALTATGLSLLNQERKDAIALWLMGTEGSEENWSRSFTEIFDAIFGENHFSLRCIATSVFASIVAVLGLWLLLGIDEGFRSRLDTVQGLGTVLAIGLAVNVTADYISLLQTRILLDHVGNLRNPVLQALVLLVDLVLTALIIWIALRVFQFTPWFNKLTGGGGADLGEVLLIFSPFAVFFYSTFATSIWTWVFVLSSWVMRGMARLRLGRWLDVEGKPVKSLRYALAPALVATGFAGSVAIGFLVTKDTEGLTALDRAVCTTTRDSACLKLAEQSGKDAAKLALLGPMLQSCGSMFTMQCVHDRLAEFRMSPAEAVRLHLIGCEELNIVTFCNNLGYLKERGPSDGFDMTRDISEAARLYDLSCQAGDVRGCTNLGNLLWRGNELTQDRVEAERLFRIACAEDELRACTTLGRINERGIHMDAPDPVEAMRLFGMGCTGNVPRGCTGMGRLYEAGAGVDQSLPEAVKYFSEGCVRGHSPGCTSAGTLLAEGRGVPPNPAEAARLYAIGCERGHKLSCTRLEETQTPPTDPQ